MPQRHRRASPPPQLARPRPPAAYPPPQRPRPAGATPSNLSPYHPRRCCRCSGRREREPRLFSFSAPFRRARRLGARAALATMDGAAPNALHRRNALLKTERVPSATWRQQGRNCSCLLGSVPRRLVDGQRRESGLRRLPCARDPERLCPCMGSKPMNSERYLLFTFRAPRRPRLASVQSMRSELITVDPWVISFLRGIVASAAFSGVCCRRARLAEAFGFMAVSRRQQLHSARSLSGGDG